MFGLWDGLDPSSLSESTFKKREDRLALASLFWREGLQVPIEVGVTALTCSPCRTTNPISKTINYPKSKFRRGAENCSTDEWNHLTKTFG